MRLGISRAGFASLIVAAVAFATPVAARAPSLAMLGTLEKGGWELRDRQSGARHKICVRTGREFVQLRHRQSNCSQLIVQDEATEVTVQYTCPGSGYGRTTIRSEGTGLAQIRSQGILNGTPFTISGEARKQGKC